MHFLLACCSYKMPKKGRFSATLCMTDGRMFEKGALDLDSCIVCMIIYIC